MNQFEPQYSVGWTLPPKAHWLLRVPIVRHIRACALGLRIDWHYSGDHKIPTAYDEWVLAAIARGEC